MLCVLIRIASLRRFSWVHSAYNYCVENGKDFTKILLFAFWPGAMINPQWLELPISRTNFHSPKDVRVIEVWLYRENNYGILFFRFAYIVFDSPEALEEQIKSKQDAELEGNKVFLDYTDERTSFKPREPREKKPKSRCLIHHNLFITLFFGSIA